MDDKYDECRICIEDDRVIRLFLPPSLKIESASHHNSSGPNRKKSGSKSSDERGSKTKCSQSASLEDAMYEQLSIMDSADLRWLISRILSGAMQKYGQNILVGNDTKIWVQNLLGKYREPPRDVRDLMVLIQEKNKDMATRIDEYHSQKKKVIPKTRKLFPNQEN